MQRLILLIGFILGVMTLGLGHVLPMFVWICSAVMALFGQVLLIQRQIVFASTQRVFLIFMVFVTACLAGTGYAHHCLNLAMADRLIDAQQKQDIWLQVRVVGISDGVMDDTQMINNHHDIKINSDNPFTAPSNAVPEATDNNPPEGESTATHTTTADMPISKFNNSWRQVVVVEPSVKGIPHQLLIGAPQRWGDAHTRPPVMLAGEVWRIHVRLKPLHSNASEGAFDVEKWLLTRDIGATGTLLAAEALPAQPDTRSYIQQLRDRIDRGRFALREHLRTFSTQHSAESVSVLVGLLTGDRALITPETTLRYQQLGISHLLAISGPHVLLAASVLTWLAIQLLNRRSRVYLRMERTRWLLPILLLTLLAYALLAGWQLPAQRTVLMASLAALLTSLRMPLPFTQILLISAGLMLLIDPLSVLSVGFWLSFGAVLVLAAVDKRLFVKEINNTPRVSAQELASQQTHSHKIRAAGHHAVGVVLSFIRLNVGLFLCLLPLVLACFGQVSLLSPMINVLTIPFFGVVIVPLNLLALLLWLIAPSLGDWLWSFLLILLDGFHHALYSILQSYPHALQPFQLSGVGMLAASLIVVIALLPKGIIPRWLIIPCLLPILVPATLRAPLTVEVLDIGQGLSVLLQTKHHAMLYDTGGKMPTERLGMGEKVVLPALYTRGIRHLDRVMLSHLDNDHSGGLDAIMAAMPIGILSSSQPYKQIPTENCLAGQTWQWDSVTFKVLAPWSDTQDPARVSASDNDNSCILQVSAPIDGTNKQQSILLVGDAGILSEQMLMLMCQDLHTDILVLGHHGSRYSSSTDFLAAVHPTRAVVSAGFFNRYGHPAPVVIDRLQAQHIAIDSTITGGSLTYNLGIAATLTPKRYRDGWLWLQR